MIKDFFNNVFSYRKNDNYNFIIPDVTNNIEDSEFEKKDLTLVSADINKNLEYLKVKFNMLINSDIKIREFTINIKPKKFSAFIIYIDGMIDNKEINDFILKPLLLKNAIKMKPSTSQENIEKKIKKFNLKNFLYSNLIPQNSVTKEKEFQNIVSKINAGFCVLFVNTLSEAFAIEVKKYNGRSVSEPITETVVKGAHEAFVENLRTNTSMIRKIINNQNLIIEEFEVGKISSTKVAICYMKDITNNDLVSETKYRVNNLDIDYLLSSGQLEQLIKDSKRTAFPQSISTERPDKTASYILEGRVTILINGSPFSIVLPAVLNDFLSSPEDVNLNFNYANFLRLIRFIALLFALFMPGLYIAITTFHSELIPSELLFAIISAREAIPFPIFFEIIIMELSFELIQEASIRAPASFSTTVGIIGALILGEAAVSANIVSPILIIIVAFTGISAFAIPDNSLRFAIRLFRFMYLILGYLAGFLGLALGFFVHFLILSDQSSFGVPFFAPYIPYSNMIQNDTLYIEPVWKREKKNRYLNTKKPNSEKHISMAWREHGK